MFKFMKKDSTNPIEDIKAHINTIKATANTPGYPDIETYLNGDRAILNNALISYLLGAKMDMSQVKYNKKGNIKAGCMKFNRRIPTITEVAEVFDLMRDFDIFEVSLMQILTGNGQPDDGSDMNMPTRAVRITTDEGKPIGRVRMITNCDEKALRSEMVNNLLDATYLINSADCMRLASMGMSARKKANLHRALIIGGTVVVLAAGATAGYIYYKKSKGNGDHHIDEMADAPEFSINDVGATPDITIDAADMPQVTMD